MWTILFQHHIFCLVKLWVFEKRYCRCKFLRIFMNFKNLLKFTIFTNFITESHEFSNYVANYACRFDITITVSYCSPVPEYRRYTHICRRVLNSNGPRGDNLVEVVRMETSEAVMTQSTRSLWCCRRWESIARFCRGSVQCSRTCCHLVRRWSIARRTNLQSVS